MNKTSTILKLVFIFVVFQSCETGDFSGKTGNFSGWGDWNVNLRALKIEGTSLVLYEYDAWGGRDSHASGYKLLDSTETFSVNTFGDLPFDFLEGIPNKEIIRGGSSSCRNDCGKNYAKTTPIFTPIEVTNSKRKNINIEHKFYQYRGFSERGQGLKMFHFENFKETRDSLFFYDLDNLKSKNREHLDSLKFRKQSVKISEDCDSFVTKLIVEDLILGEKDDEIISKMTYFLTPKNKTQVDAFSDYGIFKKVKKTGQVNNSQNLDRNN